MKTSIGRSACLSLVILALTAGAKISAVEMNLDTIFGGDSTSSYHPGGPWLKYQVDNVGPNSVLFTLKPTASITGNDKVKGFYFNFNDTLSLADLCFSAPIINSGAFTAPTIRKEENGFKAGGDGRYDILLNFDTSGGLASYFGAGDSLSYLLTYTGCETMTDASFAYLSKPSGGWGPYYAAAHIQGVEEGAWFGATTVVPEPTTAALLLAGLAVLGLRRPRS